jgi:hypothetical protein
MIIERYGALSDFIKMLNGTFVTAAIIGRYLIMRTAFYAFYCETFFEITKEISVPNLSWEQCEDCDTATHQGCVRVLL